jgi:hypothetical protein
MRVKRRARMKRKMYLLSSGDTVESTICKPANHHRFS